MDPVSKIPRFVSGRDRRIRFYDRDYYSDVHDGIVNPRVGTGD